MIFDVDGVLTDGKLWYGAGGEELKAFHAFDGHGVKLLRLADLDTAIISGRDSPAGAERGKELGLEHVWQGADAKRGGFQRMLKGGAPPSMRRHDPDYLVSNFTTTTYNRDGKAETVLSAAEMQHYPDDDSTAVTAPRVMQSKPAQPRFTVEADRGNISREGDE